MFKKFVWNSSKVVRKLCVRFRHVKPNCPHPCDFSKVEKVTICGACNPLGQNLACVLKKAEIIREIALYDESNVRGVALDLAHINTKTRVKPNSGEMAFKDAIRHADIIVITNGFDACLTDEEKCLHGNASMMYKYALKIASVCPEALVCIVTPPVNVMLPLFSEVMKVCGTYDPNKVFGVCSLIEMRANTVIADYLSLDPAAVKVPFVGGATPSTLVPLLSHAKPYNEFSDKEIKCLIAAILETTEDCKRMHTAAPLSSAYAISRFILTLAAGLCTCNCAMQTAFVRSNVLPQVEYFTSTVRTDTNGVVANFGLPKIHDHELNLLSGAIATLEQDLAKGCCLFRELHRQANQPEVDEICAARKPFITKTPCPPDPPCIPSDVCQVKLPPDPCAPASTDSMPCFCCNPK